MTTLPGKTTPEKAPAPARPALSLAIQLGDQVRALPTSRTQLRRWVASAIEHDARFTLRFVGEGEGRTLNLQYRGRDDATNVLTFTYGAPHEENEPIEADIVICMPVLEREARARGIAVVDHLAHLVVHGVLHASGHDHEHEEDAQRMEAREAAVLAKFRIADPYLDE